MKKRRRPKSPNKPDIGSKSLSVPKWVGQKLAAAMRLIRIEIREAKSLLFGIGYEPRAPRPKKRPSKVRRRHKIAAGKRLRLLRLRATGLSGLVRAGEPIHIDELTLYSEVIRLNRYRRRHGQVLYRGEVEMDVRGPSEVPRRIQPKRFWGQS